MKKLTLTYVVFIIIFGFRGLFATTSSAEVSVVGQNLPKIQCEALTGTELELPHGKATLLLIGFEKACIPHVREWIYTIRKEKLLPNSIELYTVPVLGDSWQARLLQSVTIEMLKQIVPRKEHAAVYMAKGVQRKLKDFLCGKAKKADGVKIADEVHLVLVDSKGKIRWQFSGKLNQKAKNSLKQIASTLPKS